MATGARDGAKFWSYSMLAAARDCARIGVLILVALYSARNAELVATYTPTTPLLTLLGYSWANCSTQLQSTLVSAVVWTNACPPCAVADQCARSATGGARKYSIWNCPGISAGFKNVAQSYQNADTRLRAIEAQDKHGLWNFMLLTRYACAQYVNTNGCVRTANNVSCAEDKRLEEQACIRETDDIATVCFAEWLR